MSQACVQDSRYLVKYVVDTVYGVHDILPSSMLEVRIFSCHTRGHPLYTWIRLSEARIMPYRTF